MPALRTTHVEAYVFRRKGRRLEFVVLRRARGRLAGIWQPVTGKLEPGETAFEAARREVMEEIGIEPRRWWRLESPTVYFDAAHDVVEFLPVFVSEIGARDAVRISREHDAYRFHSAREAARKFLWDSQRASLDQVRRQILRGGPAARALEITPTSEPRIRRK